MFSLSTPVHEIPLAEFIKMPPVDQETVTRAFERNAGRFLRSLEDDVPFCASWQRVCSGRFEIASSANEWGVAGRVIGREVSSGNVVGGASSMHFFILQDHRGHGLGAELLLQAMADGIKEPRGRGHLLSPAGRATRISAHRLAVTRALQDGGEVPNNVLGDYPDLWGGAATPAAAVNPNTKSRFMAQTGRASLQANGTANPLMRSSTSPNLRPSHNI